MRPGILVSCDNDSLVCRSSSWPMLWNPGWKLRVGQPAWLDWHDENQQKTHQTRFFLESLRGLSLGHWTEWRLRFWIFQQMYNTSLTCCSWYDQPSSFFFCGQEFPPCLGSNCFADPSHLCCLATTFKGRLFGGKCEEILQCLAILCDLFGMVKTWPFQRFFSVTSKGMKRSRLRTHLVI